MCFSNKVRRLAIFSLLLFMWPVVFSVYSQEPQADTYGFIHPVPGKYGSDQLVRISGRDDTAYQYRFTSSIEPAWIEYRVPLELTALPGEERSFELQVREKMAQNSGDIQTLIYVIDKREPEPPVISIQRQENTTSLLFNIRDADDEVQYWISSFKRNQFRRWTGGAVPLDEGTVIKAYAIDTAGNHSTVVTRRLFSGVQCASVEGIEILSPVEGEFENHQLLVISNSECFEWIRYTTDGSDPEASGKIYTQPVRIDVRGKVRLRVAAKVLNAPDIRTETAAFSVSENPVLDFDVPGGGFSYKTEPLPVPETPDGFEAFYSLRDSPVSIRNPVLTGAVSYMVTEGMTNHIVYRIGIYDTAAKKMYQYRSLYTIDRRIPAPPVIETEGTPPFQQEETVRIQVPEGTTVYYTTDGSTPDRFSPVYRKPLSVKPGGISSIGAVDVQAVARFPNGNSSAIARSLLSFDREAPSVPVYKIVSRTQNETVFELSHPERNIDFVYRLGYDRSTDLQPDQDSPVCGRIVRIAFPYGYSGRAFVRFAAKDEAGNLSQATAIEEVSVDTVPPVPPEITVRDLRMHMRGEGTLYYKIDPLSTEYKPYSDTVALMAEPGRKIEYQIYGIAEDTEGNKSAPSKLQVVYDRRSVEVPHVSGVWDSEHYNTDVNLRIVEAEADSITYYTLSAVEKGNAENSDTPPEARIPDRNDKVFEEVLCIRGNELEEIEYHIIMRTYLPGSDSWSDPVEYRFVIDRLPPEYGDIPKMIAPGISNKPVFIRETDIREGEELWLYFSETKIELDTGSAEMIRDKRLSARTGIYLNGRPSEEVTYYIYTSAFDSAGNSTVSGPFSLLIDRQRPPVPTLTGIPNGRFTRSAVTLSKPDECEDTIVYEMSDDDSIPEVPTAKSAVLDAYLSLKGTEEGEKSYYVLYRAIDSAGNLSDTAAVHVTVVKTIPDKPVPIIKTVGQRVWEVSFQCARDAEVYLRIEGDEFIEYSYPFLYELPPENDIFSMEAYSLDASGKRSEIITRRISAARYGASPVKGVIDGKLYNSSVSIKPQSQSIDLRYELRNAHTSLPVLTEESPRLSGELIIPADPEKESFYRLVTGVYESETGLFHSISTYDFTVDISAPLPPELLGIEAGIHYTEDQIIEIASDDEKALIYYSIRESGGPETPYKRYTKPEKIQVRGGVRKDYSVELWAVDEAGNRSATKQVSFVIDKAGIYVAPDGRDGYSGGKDSPFRTLDRALYEAAHSNRNTIFLSRGEFTISKPVPVDSQLSIRGGFLREGWLHESGNRTLISVSDSFSPGRSMFELRGGTLRIDDIILSNLDLSGPVIDQQGNYSNLIIRGCLVLHANGSASVCIASSGGNLLISDTKIETAALENGRVIELNSSSLIFEDSRIDTADGSRSIELFHIEKGEAVFKSSSMHVGKSVRSVTLNARDSEISITDSFIENGAGSVKSTAIRQTGGTLNLQNSTIGQNAENNRSAARMAAGIETDGTRVTINNTVLNSRALNGIIQIKADSSSLVIENSIINNSAAQEFSYLVRLNGGSCTISDTSMVSQASYDVYGIKAEGRTAVLVRSAEMKLGRAENESIGFEIGSEVIGTVQNNIIISNGGPASTAVRQAGTGFQTGEGTVTPNLKLIENTFSGWQYLLINDIERVRGVESLEAEKPPFDRRTPHRGNREE